MFFLKGSVQRKLRWSNKLCLSLGIGLGHRLDITFLAYENPIIFFTVLSFPVGMHNLLASSGTVREQGEEGSARCLFFRVFNTNAIPYSLRFKKN